MMAWHIMLSHIAQASVVPVYGLIQVATSYGATFAVTCGEKGVRLAQKMPVGPCILVGIQR